MTVRRKHFNTLFPKSNLRVFLANVTNANLTADQNKLLNILSAQLRGLFPRWFLPDCVQPGGCAGPQVSSRTRCGTEIHVFIQKNKSRGGQHTTKSNNQLCLCHYVHPLLISADGWCCFGRMLHTKVSVSSVQLGFSFSFCV